MAATYKHVFISYCHDDLAEVARLREDLVKAGENIWWDQDIKGGQDFKFAIRQAIRQSYAFVLCLSKESQKRTVSGIYPEIMDAIAAYREYRPDSVFLIPVRLSNCEIPPIEIDVTRTLDHLQYVDLFPDSKREEGLRRLIEGLRLSPHHPLSGLSIHPDLSTLGLPAQPPGAQEAEAATSIIETDYRVAVDGSKSKRNAAEPGSATLVDFAIITAITVEREAVCKAFGLTAEHRVRKGSRVYWRGQLPLSDGGAYEIVVTQSLDMANVDAALLTSDTLHHWEPGAALMVGIAASASGDVGMGDVVVGSDIYYYERGKVKPEGIKPEPKIYPADATLLANAQALPNWSGRIDARRPDRKRSRPKVHFGAIASGEKVIADTEARNQITSAHRKIVAIEMEGYGFSKAVWQSFDRVRHLVIRSICDDGSPAKDDAWHAYAGASAASFAKHFLADAPVAPRNDARPASTENSVSERSPTRAADRPVGAAAQEDVGLQVPTAEAPAPPSRATGSGVRSFREQRFRQELTELQGMYELVSKKINALERALVIETGVAVKFQLKEQLSEEKTRLADINARISEIERELQ